MRFTMALMMGVLLLHHVQTNVPGDADKTDQTSEQMNKNTTRKGLPANQATNQPTRPNNQQQTRDKDPSGRQIQGKKTLTKEIKHSGQRDNATDQKTTRMAVVNQETRWQKERKQALSNLSEKSRYKSNFLSCKNRCLNERDPGGETRERCCSCDPYCHYFKDCCVDYDNYCREGNTTNSTMQRKVPDEEWTCRSDIWMIVSCAKNWTNQNISQLCSTERRLTADNYEDELPLVTHDNKTFANQFCAHCHGYTKNQMESYELNSDCMVNSSLLDKKTNETLKRPFETCDNLSSKPKVGTPRRYCSADEDRIMMVEPQSYEFFVVKPMSVILDINEFKPKLEPKLVLVPYCLKGMVYDIYLKTCRKTQTFVPMVSHLKKYRIELWIKVETETKVFFYSSKKNDLSTYFAEAFEINSTRMLSFEAKLDDSSEGMFIVAFSIELTNKIDGNVKPVGNNVSIIHGTTEPFLLNMRNQTFKILKIISKPLTCVQADTYSLKEYQVLPGTKASVIINKTGEVLTDRDYFSNNTKMVDGKSIPFGNIVVCRQMLSGNCSGAFILLQRHEYDIFTNRSVFYKAAGDLYEYGTYMRKNGTVMICSTFKRSYQKRDREVSSLNDTVLTILTYIGLTVSILCLVYVLVTYGLFPDLRTLPGINLMNLSSALLVAQLLWLVGSGLTFAKHGCTAIAIILHYSFLASFMWMSIIAFDTWRAFAGKSCRPSRNDRRQRHKRILRMMTIGWLPLIIYVSVCVALDQSGAVAIRYGGDKGCWINNSRANLYFFAIPVAIAISWNAVFFVLIVKAIKKVKKQSQMVTSQHQARRNSPVYARIAALMGFTWVFGFLAPYTTQYLFYPFVILSTLQGLYIAVAFGLTPRVRAMYKTTICGQSTDMKMTSNTTESNV